MIPTRTFFTGSPLVQHKGHQGHQATSWFFLCVLCVHCVDSASRANCNLYSAMPTEFGFRLTHTDGGARRGRMTTPHGSVETPAFMPVGTQGAVKGVTHRDMHDLGAEIML